MRDISLKVLQNYVYGIFVEFDRVCRKLDIKYSMEGGTLLGAVKYKDFVPWDDDIDVIMLREEYEKFLKLAPAELDNKFFLQSYNNVLEFPLNYAKLCLNGSRIYNYCYSHLKNMNHGIFIDIFPIDNVEPKTLRMHCSKVGVLTSARKTKLKIDFGKVRFAKKLVFKAISLFPMKFLCERITKECSKYNNTYTGWRYEVCNSNRNFKPLNAEMYENFIELQFRDRKFYAVKDYDKFLRSRFGDDYMESLPPEEKRKPSHCPNIEIDY